jgi:hypothetical protein
MIVNLAEATTLVLTNADLNEDDIRHVIFYNHDSEEHQYCSYQEFVDIAEEINYDENDTTFTGRRIIKSDLSIVADTWWLRRTRDDEDTETWVYQELPMNIEDLNEGMGEFNVDYVIGDLDVMSDEYKELVDNNTREYPYAKATDITINGKSHSIINDDGIDKVIKNGNVAVIVATDGRYWSSNNRLDKDPRMLFHPELVKLVMEGTYEDGDVFNIEYMELHLNLNMTGFHNDSFKSLTIAWLPRGMQFNVSEVSQPKTGITRETIEYPKQINWLFS